MGCDNVYPSIFAKFQQVGVTTHNISGTSLQRSNHIGIVIGVSLNCLEFQVAFGGFGNECKRDNPPINLFRGQVMVPPDARIVQPASNFIKDGSRPDKMKGLILQQQAKDPARRPLWPKACTDVDIGVEDCSNHGSRSTRLASAVLGFVGKVIGLALRDLP